MPVDDENTVNIEPLPNYLSDAEIEVLQEATALPEFPTEEELVESFALAKTLIVNMVMTH